MRREEDRRGEGGWHADRCKERLDILILCFPRGLINPSWPLPIWGNTDGK